MECLLRVNASIIEEPMLEMMRTIVHEAGQLPDLCTAELLHQLLLVREQLQGLAVCVCLSATAVEAT